MSKTKGILGFEWLTRASPPLRTSGVYHIAHRPAEPPFVQTNHPGQIERPKPAWKPNPEDDTDFSDLVPPEEGEGEEGPGSPKKGSRQAFCAGEGQDDQNDQERPTRRQAPRQAGGDNQHDFELSSQ